MNVQIKKLNINNLRNNEELSFMNEVQTSVKAAGTDAQHLNVNDAFTAFDASLGAFKSSIVSIQKSAITTQMTEKDGNRDNLFIGICEQVRTGLRHFSDEKRKAAEALIPVIDTYQGVYARPFDEESGFINNFLQEMELEKYKVFIETLNLKEWFTQLDAANDECIALTSQRTADVQTREAGEALKYRKALDITYNTLVMMINAQCMVNGEAKYKEVIDYINARIKHYEDVLAQRAGTTAAATKKADEDEAKKRGITYEEYLVIKKEEAAARREANAKKRKRKEIPTEITVIVKNESSGGNTTPDEKPGGL